jgi:hypothetical protein
MIIRSLVSLGTLAIAVTSILPTPIAAQGIEEVKKRAAGRSAKQWTPPLTDGHPDLQGNWVNKSATPLERPKELEGRQFLTDAEVVELKRQADRVFANGNSDFPGGDDFFLAALANPAHYKNVNATSGSEFVNEREFDNRTSLIVNPPDGKIPDYTPEGQRRQTANLAAFFTQNDPAGPKDLTNVQRCITWGVPMLRTGPYTSHYQIVQTPGYVVLVMESIHDARIIPLDGRPHLPQNIRLWNGDSLGRWEGKTLVVDTSNFSPKSNFMGSAENLHLVERFTRTAPDEITYEVGVSDPTTWTKPWTAVLRLKQTQDKIYEFACHEGNFQIVEGILTAARVVEKAIETAPKRSQ